MSADDRDQAWGDDAVNETAGEADSGAEWRDLALSLERGESDGETLASLYFERVGPPQAPTVYYLHGGPGYNSSSFRELVGDELADYDVIYADARGGGRSSGPSGNDIDVLADDVRAVLHALQVESAVLLAHGFGAMVAAQVAADEPALVRRLVLVNPWLSMPHLAQDLNDAALRRSGQLPEGAGDDDSGATSGGSGAADDADDGLSSDPAALVAEAFALVNPKVLFDDLEFRSPAARLRLEHVDAVALSGEMQDEVEAQVWSEQRLRALAGAAASGVEVVVISGAHDGTSYPSQAELALERAPNALFSLLDGAHYPWIDDEEAFGEVLRQALAEASASA